MGRSSVAEPSTASPSFSHDPHGNQLPPNGDGLVVSPSAMASREIFQGLFKDLGKQAMAMESILRLVCGKVDKLESWVTEMSFGMTELDLKLRNIAHNIEGTAANVDDVPAANRWGVPQEEDDTPIATVVKKVGVAPNKKKQMRMTGTVANILDQLTTVTEMPTAAESETESHASDKRKLKSKAKKAKATSDAVSSPLALSAATTPRAAEAKVKTKTSKTKIPKHPTKITEVPVEVVTKVAVEELNEKSVIYGTAVVAENLKSVSEQAEKERRQEKHAVVAQEATMEHVRLNEKEIAEHTVEIAELGSDHIEEMTEITVEHVLRNATVRLEPADVMPVAVVEPLPPSIHAVQIVSPDNPLQGEDSTKARRNLSDESISIAAEQPPHGMNHAKGEEPGEPKQIDADPATEMLRREVAQSIPIHPIADAAPAISNDVENPFTIPHHGVKTQTGAVEVATKPNLVDGLGSDVSPSEQARQPPLEDAVVLSPAATLHARTPQRDHQPAALTKSSSNSSRREVSNATDENVHMPSLSKKGSRQSSIRKAITQRQPSIKRKQTPEQTSSAIEDDKKPREPVARETGGPVALEPIGKTPPVTRSREVAIPTAPITSTSVVVATEIADSSEDDDNDNDNEDEDSSPLSSDSDESVLDLNEPPPKSSTNSASTPVEKRMTVKMTRAFTALKNLTEADVLSPEEVAELKQRTTQKWFRVRDHVKDKSKKDVANIMLKRKKNIFTVSNRIELLEDKSREVYASIKQVNMDLKGKLDMSTFDGLRRHVHDIHASLQVLDDRIAKGNTPAMDYIKQIAKDSEAMRAFFLEQLQVTREHCDGNHVETIALFDEQWQRVLAIEKSIQDKVAALVTEYDDKLHDLPDYTEALEGIRRAIRKKADSKALRELEARVLGHDADSEDCLVRCLSCHKEVVNAGHDPSQPLDDNDAATVGSPHFKRVNPGTAAARVYRSNVPLNAQPLGMSDVITEIGLSGLEEAASSVASAAPSNSKPINPSRRVTRSDDPRPSPLSLIHVTATRAISTGSEANRPISAPASVLKKKAPAQSSAKQ